MSASFARLALLLAFAAPALALAAPEPCSLITIDEASSFSARPATKTRTLTTGNWTECSYLDAKQTAVFTLQLREVKLPKAELDQEAENLQKIYRTTVKPVEVGDGGFWLTTRQELYFRKGKTMFRIVIASPAGSAKSAEVAAQSVARMVESRLK